MPNRGDAAAGEGSTSAGETSKLAFMASPVEVVVVAELQEHEAKEKMWVRMISTCSLIEELQRRATEARSKRRWRIVLTRHSFTTNDIDLKDFIFGKLSEDEPADPTTASCETRAGAHDEAPTEPTASPSLEKEEEGLEMTKSDPASESK